MRFLAACALLALACVASAAKDPKQCEGVHISLSAWPAVCVSAPRVPPAGVWLG